jgi:mono/diheme cytochrome c family protein
MNERTVGCVITCAFLFIATEANSQSTNPPDNSGKQVAFDGQSGAMDEAMAGQTVLGTPISKRTEHCFPAESQDVFWQMDQVATVTGPDRKLQPLEFDADGDGKLSDQERNAIRGRNTWLLWGGGNETFWGWLQERGYGLVDFVILMDSRERSTRFKRAGLINQPGFIENRTANSLGLYLDSAIPDKAVLTLPSGSKGAIGASRLGTRELQAKGSCLNCHSSAGQQNDSKRLFTPGDEALYKQVVSELGGKGKLSQDGLDPEIYGYASGIFGLRLFLNPDFFGDTSAAKKARAYWNDRVKSGKHGDYYNDSKINADPKLIRPFRVSMSCGFCHVGPHPLNPPSDPENPAWENLSSIIGDQYWSPPHAFGNLLRKENFLFHFLNSQPPGTIDTSLVSTDHMNNPNTINAVFDLPARLVRAQNNATELQSPENLLMASVEDKDASVTHRHFPRVLLDGADSCGALVALLRVPLNIGTYSEEWRRCHNPIIGFKHQKPFRVAACQSQSVYWRANERYRIPYLAAFFTFTNQKKEQSSTAPMKLKDAQGCDTHKIFDGEVKAFQAGRDVFVRNCAICHSSKQPNGLTIEFAREMAGGWENAPAGKEPTHYTLPMDFAFWDQFKKSPSYADYVAKISAMAGPAPADQYAEDSFIKDNFLSSEVRIPITLVGSNSGRSAGTNGKRGQVWDNFSSEGYKALPAVGQVRYYNPYSSHTVDAYGNNDSYLLEGGGPGYYRPASLISLWATAPYLHNNTLGLYDPVLPGATSQNPGSVDARLAAFEDGIQKLLWYSKRAQPAKLKSAQPPVGELRPGLAQSGASAAAAKDPGYIYRIPQDTDVMIPPRFIAALVEGILGSVTTIVLTLGVPLLLVAIFLIGVFKGKPRQVGAVFLLLAALTAAVVAYTRIGAIVWWAWPAVVLFVALGVAFLFRWNANRVAARSVFAAFAVVALAATIGVRLFLSGHLGPLSVGPIPKGTPVNLMMNIDPEKKQELASAFAGVFRATLKIKRDGLKEDAACRVFEQEAGPGLLRASKCPDFVLDRGHWFGEGLTDEQKGQLIAFLKTL